MKHIFCKVATDSHKKTKRKKAFTWEGVTVCNSPIKLTDQLGELFLHKAFNRMRKS